MRKTHIIFMGLILLLPFSSCQNSETNRDEFIALGQTIKTLIPETINGDFSMPNYAGYTVEYELNEDKFTNDYVYRSPFIDMETKLKITIKQGTTEYVDEKTVQLLAADSGHNQYELHLTLPTSLNNVTREDYTQANVVAKMNVNGVTETVHETTQAKIRGRGHSTWQASKKPYRLRFDKNTSIFGMPAAKNYVLLAEYADKSLLRNVFAHKISSRMNRLPYTLQTRFVDLYINTTYLGAYVLTEQVEIHKNKLNIESIPGLADTGYFLELDMRLFNGETDPRLDWISVRGYGYDIKEPDPDEINFSQINADFIYEYLIATENALIAKTDYDELIDVDAFIDFFLIQELTKNVDVGYSSVFLFKEAGGKLRPGPLWDFDYAFGNAGYIDYSAENFYGMRQAKSRWFKLLMDVPAIREKFKARYLDFYTNILPDIYPALSSLADSIEALAERNFQKWQLLIVHIPPAPSEITEIQTHIGQVDYLIHWLETRSAWLNTAVQGTNFANGNFEIEE